MSGYENDPVIGTLKYHVDNPEDNGWHVEWENSYSNGKYSEPRFELLSGRSVRQVIEEVMDKFTGVSDVVTEEILTALNREYNLL